MDSNDASNRAKQISKSMLLTMALIVGAIVALSLYANWQNTHRDRIETTIVTRFTPSPRASATP